MARRAGIKRQAAGAPLHPPTTSKDHFPLEDDLLISEVDVTEKNSPYVRSKYDPYNDTALHDAKLDISINSPRSEYEIDVEETVDRYFLTAALHN